MRRYYLIYVVIIIVTSCKKHELSVYNNNTDSLYGPYIDTLVINQFDNVTSQGSLHNVDSAEIIEKGFCWSLQSIPVLTDSAHSLKLNEPFSAIINSIGQHITIYIWAYYKTEKLTRFSKTKIIQTKGVIKIWEKEIVKTNLTDIIEVMLTPEKDFLILFGGGLPRLTKIDTSGNVLWDYQYASGVNKAPVFITVVEDGYLIVMSDASMDYGWRTYLVKVDRYGRQQWEKAVYAPKKWLNIPIRILETKDGYYLYTSKSFNVNSNGEGYNSFSIDDCLMEAGGKTIKTNSFAIQDKNIIYSGANFKAVNTSDSGMLYVTSSIVYKFDKGYNIEWENKSVKGWVPIQIVNRNKGNIIEFASYPGGSGLLKIDPNNGNVISSWLYDSWKYGGITPLAVYINDQEQYYISATAGEKLGFRFGNLIIKQDKDGKFLWDYYLFKSPEYSYASPKRIITIDNKVYAFGILTNQTNDNNNSAFMIKLME